MSSVPRISAEEALAKMGEGFAYVDVRTVEEFELEHPEGALNVPWQHASDTGMIANPDFLPVMEKLFAKDAKIILGCRSGNRSLKAANFLVERGFTTVIDQRAGMIGVRGAFGEVVEPGWPGAGLPVASGSPAGRSYADLLAK